MAAALAKAPRWSAPSSIGISSPGMTGTPDSIMSVRADILSPIVSMAYADGPIQRMPADSTCRAKSALSERNP